MKKEIPNDTINWFDGGINTPNNDKMSLAKSLDDNLKVFKMMFETMANNEPLENKL